MKGNENNKSHSRTLLICSISKISWDKKTSNQFGVMQKLSRSRGQRRKRRYLKQRHLRHNCLLTVG